MRKIYNPALFILICLALLCLAAPSYSADADSHIARIQKAYEGIKDLRGSFSQKSVIRDLNKTETYKGEFFIKPPLRMKWAYKGKAAQDLFINNDTVLIYKKGDNQAYKSRFDKATYGQTPVALLSGFGNIREEFTVSGKGDALTLKPKKPIGNVTSIKITVADEDFPIRAFVITDSYANTVEIELRDMQINTGLKDSLFDLTLPKGVNIFEQ
ncbi:MAG: outer membrane lipoprotein carrier protein LolA [Nitrospirae bacterium]|nr:outer membrane lipoprotein carrier protein LolA [Nitrospirota bacterium]